MASILETFFILFQTDAQRVADETDEAKRSAEELAEALDRVGDVDPGGVREVAEGMGQAGEAAGKMADNVKRVPPEVAKVKEEIKAADRAAEQMNKTIVGWAGAIGGAIGGMLSVGVAINSIRQAFNDLIELGERARRFNISPEGLNAFNEVLEDFGGNTQDAEIYMRRFSDNIKKAYGDAESDAAKALKEVKLSAADAKGDLKDTEQVLLDLAGALEGVSRQAAIDKLRRLGIIDPAMIDMVLKGRAELERLLRVEKENSAITNENAKAARDLKQAWGDAQQAMGNITLGMLGGLIPVLTKAARWVETVAKWTRDNRTLVTGFFIGLAAALGVVAVMLWGSYIPAWIAAAAATIVALAPVLEIIAAVLAAAAAFALLWEDVSAFLNGQPSLLGDLVERYEWVRKTVEAIGDAWRYLSRVVPPILRAIGRAGLAFIEDFLDNAGRMGPVFRVIFNAAAWAFRQIWRVAGPILTYLWENIQLLARIHGTAMKAMWLAAQMFWTAIRPIAEPLFNFLIAGIQAAAQVWLSVQQVLWKAWGGLFDFFIGKLNFVINLFRGFLDLIEKGRARVDAGLDAVSERGRARAAVAAGQQQVRAANDNRLAAQTSNSVNNRNRTQQTNVTVQKVEVQTQATDAKGMARAAGGALTSELRRASSQYDDGVDR